MKRLVVIALLGIAASTAAAQDGAMDMTGMGIYSQEDAVMEAAREPDAGSVRTASSRKARANCARIPELRRHFGAKDPRIQKATALCRKLGHPTG
ncbi:hypothetical protein [Sphingosinicella sp. BN140058]|uniref:hypothetical protein n=1 Tax=Sphingosinicella sp. BN140058 TaxID=1892855 RepID=UPI0010105A0F|nr:hypothetical protein [Sphingosinicella sp. BN140058]QAY76804.1 hypothetical protein ETR14_10070 [Sphingosinicella sp. BN140058]